MTFNLKRLTRRALPLIITALLATPAQTARFPFDPSRGLVEVECTINGALKGRFGLDTGADLFYLDREFAKRAGVIIPENDKTKIVRGIAGESAVATVQLRSLAIGDERIYNIPVEIVDLQALAGDKAGDKADSPDGLIGYQTLKNFYITIDYSNKQIDLFTHEPRFDPESVCGVLFEQYGHFIVVEAQINSQPLRLFLDYCASHTLLTPAGAAKLGLPDEGRHFVESITLGEINAKNIPLYVKSLGNLEISEEARLDGILGFSFLQHFRITVDYGRKTLLFHKRR